MGGESMADRILSIMSIPKSAMAAGEISLSGRQHSAMMGSPLLWAKGLKQNWKIFMDSPVKAQILDKDLITSDLGQLAVTKGGMKWNKVGGGFSQGTEQFQATKTGTKVARIISKIPVIGKLTAKSEAAFTVGGNAFRLQVFEKLLGGRDPKSLTPKQLLDIGRMSNLLTGEGDVSSLGKLAPALSGILFATRLFASRIQTMTELIPGLSNLDVEARKVLAWQMLKA
jgi:hypothetical protein